MKSYISHLLVFSMLNFTTFMCSMQQQGQSAPAQQSLISHTSDYIAHTNQAACQTWINFPSWGKLLFASVGLVSTTGSFYMLNRLFERNRRLKAYEQGANILQNEDDGYQESTDSIVPKAVNIAQRLKELESKKESMKKTEEELAQAKKTLNAIQAIHTLSNPPNNWERTQQEIDDRLIHACATTAQTATQLAEREKMLNKYIALLQKNNKRDERTFAEQQATIRRLLPQHVNWGNNLMRQHAIYNTSSFPQIAAMNAPQANSLTSLNAAPSAPILTRSHSWPLLSAQSQIARKK